MQTKYKILLVMAIGIPIGLWAASGDGSQSTSSTTSTSMPTSTPTQYEGLSVNELRLLDETLQPKFNDLLRDFEDYQDARVFFRGEVAQVLSRDDDDYQVRVNVTKGEYDFWEDGVLIRYSLDVGPRLLEDDIVEFVGVVTSLWETKSSLGQNFWIPVINVMAISLEGK